MASSKHQVRFPGESPSYRAARDKLLEAEIELRRATEAVAAQRRKLPLAGHASRRHDLAGMEPVRRHARWPR